MTRAHATTDHQRIRQWAEARGGHPAAVITDSKQGLLRIDFDPPDEALRPIDWDTFFKTFDHRRLAFLYQDVTADGEPSHFSKFIDRGSTEAADLSDDNPVSALQEASQSGGGQAALFGEADLDTGLNQNDDEDEDTRNWDDDDEIDEMMRRS